MHKNKNEKGQRPANVMDLSDYLNKEVSVYFNGGREIKGILKSYDTNQHLILDNVWEYFQSDKITLETTSSQSKVKSRELGLVFVRGNEIATIFPCAMTEISNPFQP